MLTPQQYDNLYKSVNMEDANLFLQKLRWSGYSIKLIPN
jgi:hypothetical protein